MSDLQVDEEYVGVVNLWLRAQSELSALVANRVYANSLPAAKTYPLARVMQIGGGTVNGTSGWLRRPMLQFDVFDSAGQEARAFKVAGTIRALIEQRLPQTLSQNGVTFIVSGVRVGSMNRTHDETSGLPRVRFDVTLTVHPDN